HITCIIKRTKQLIGLIYHQFYSLSSPTTLLSLYNTICFALKMISKSWFTPYSTLLSSLNLTTLEHQRKRSKLLFFYKINNGLTHLTLPLTPHPPPPPMSHHYCPYNYIVPFLDSGTLSQ
uniref:Uncharacterized protein n=1 Tax=Amphimedon queenslandica TaxID=400682 RepID=A0A1X7UW12_AMPQE